MKRLMDIHTHAVASGHAYSTVDENLRWAAEQGLQLVALTDHAPAMKDTTCHAYFANLHVLPEMLHGVRLLKGIELNILDTDGKTDLPQELLDKLDYAIASMHYQNFRPKTREENTAAFLNVMKNPVIKILGHIDNPQYDIDYDAVVKSAGENGVILEINEASLAPYGYRGDTHANCAQILSCCRKYLVPIVLSSDSHGTEHIGDFTYAADFVHETMFPESLILNNQIPKLKMLLSIR